MLLSRSANNVSHCRSWVKLLRHSYLCFCLSLSNSPLNPLTSSVSVVACAVNLAISIWRVAIRGSSSPPPVSSCPSVVVLTAVPLQRIARGLELPTTAALEELRQMVEGKLENDGEDPMDVQVVFAETDEDRIAEQTRDIPHYGT